MAKFCVLASSSRGNSTYISCAGASVLVDAGISCRRIVSGIAAAGGDAAKLSAVLITHEHSDHINGLLNLIKKTGAAVWATAPVLSYIAENGFVPAGTVLNEVSCRGFEIGEIAVRAFATPHDAAASVGYRFEFQSGEKAAVATDLGHITDEVREGVTGCDTVLLESNYDSQLLKLGPYPYFLKRRIASEHGHLENADSAGFCCELVRSGTARLLLGHLSRENNNPALAFQTALDALCGIGARPDIDFELSVAPYDEPSRVVRF